MCSRQAITLCLSTERSTGVRASDPELEEDFDAFTGAELNDWKEVYDNVETVARLSASHLYGEKVQNRDGRAEHGGPYFTS